MKPIYIELYEKLKYDIINNYQVGQKLPSIMQISNFYNVSKNSVINAISQLYAEGYIDSIAKKGYFVSNFNQELLEEKKEFKLTKPPPKKSYRFDFFPAKLDKELFPIKAFKRLQTKALNSSLDFANYSDAQGEIGLREEIAKYLNSSRATKANIKNIVITSGFIESLKLIAKLLKKDYSYFGMENPGYYIAKEIFKEYNYKIENIAIKKDGLDINSIKKAQIIYTTPSHQYPTGAILPISKRLELIKKIKAKNGFLIEDDYDSELKYYTRPIPSMQGLEPNQVIYFGTLSKALSPALRVSFLVLPNSILKLYKASYESHFCQVNLVTQKTLELFFKEGFYERHLKKARTTYKQKHDLLKELLEKYLKDSYKIVSQGGGLSILIEPKVNMNLAKLDTLAKKNGIKLYFTKDVSSSKSQTIRLGFGGFSQDELKEAIKELSKVWQQALKD